MRCNSVCIGAPLYSPHYVGKNIGKSHDKIRLFASQTVDKIKEIIVQLHGILTA